MFSFIKQYIDSLSPVRKGDRALSSLDALVLIIAIFYSNSSFQKEQEWENVGKFIRKKKYLRENSYSENKAMKITSGS